MGNWKSATEMCALTQQKIDEYNESIERRVPQYMDKVMARISATALHRQYNCTVELRPDIAEDGNIIEDITNAVKRHLQKLGYNVKCPTRTSLQINWGR